MQEKIIQPVHGGFHTNRLVLASMRKFPENNLRKIRKAMDLSCEQIAERVEPQTSGDMIRKIEVGDRQLTHSWMNRIANALHISPDDLIVSNKGRITEVVGYVGAGVVYSYDDHPKGHGLEEVPCPRGYENESVVAVKVRGESMRPMLRDGYLLFYSRKYDGVPSESLNQVCVVKLADDGMMVREVTKGSKPGLYHLIAHNGESSFDVKLEWAAKIIEYRPA